MLVDWHGCGVVRAEGPSAACWCRWLAQAALQRQVSGAKSTLFVMPACHMPFSLLFVHPSAIHALFSPAKLGCALLPSWPLQDSSGPVAAPAGLPLASAPTPASQQPAEQQQQQLSVVFLLARDSPSSNGSAAPGPAAPGPTTPQAPRGRAGASSGAGGSSRDGGRGGGQAGPSWSSEDSMREALSGAHVEVWRWQNGEEQIILHGLPGFFGVLAARPLRSGTVRTRMTERHQQLHAWLGGVPAREQVSQPSCIL